MTDNRRDFKPPSVRRLVRPLCNCGLLVMELLFCFLCSVVVKYSQPLCGQRLRNYLISGSAGFCRGFFIQYVSCTLPLSLICLFSETSQKNVNLSDLYICLDPGAIICGSTDSGRDRLDLVAINSYCKLEHALSRL